MGHVDHGKTTLLDYLRNSQIVKQEFGGITQHIGAFVVPFKNDSTRELVTFLDTPGHSAFAAMRQRGADVTDLVVLVVACDDGVLEQTVESINYAKESGVPIIVAVNKIDKFEKDPKTLKNNIDLLRKQLIVHDVICEPDGGDVQLVNVSALKGTGVEDLKEAILALAETLELKADIDCKVSGRIIESLVHPHRGKLCTVLVQRGNLQKGDIIISGYNWARVRALFNERNQAQQSCSPGLPIQVIGWREDELPSAGDLILQVDSEAEAKKIINNLIRERLSSKAFQDAQAAAERYEEFYKVYKAKLVEKRNSGRKYGRIMFTPRGVRPKESGQNDDASNPNINLILKCDVDGSLEAILNLLETYDKDNKQLVKIDIMHYGVGGISDNDYILAQTFPNTVIYGFNVKPLNQKILTKAKQDKIDVKLFNVIYHLIDDLKARLAEKQPELEREVVVGQAVVLEQFSVTEKGKKKKFIAGCRCSKGSLRVEYLYRLMRNSEIITEGLIVKTLKHLKDEVKEIEKNRECGITFSNLDESIQFKPGDLLIAYEKQKYKAKLKWDLKGFS